LREGFAMRLPFEFGVLRRFLEPYTERVAIVESDRSAAPKEGCSSSRDKVRYVHERQSNFSLPRCRP
jgi:hypothetical protein